MAIHFSFCNEVHHLVDAGTVDLRKTINPNTFRWMLTHLAQRFFVTERIREEESFH